MLLVYSEKTSERLQFTLNFLFKDKGIAVDYTNNESEFIHFKGVKLNYSKRAFDDPGLTIVPHGILSETDIKESIEVVYDVDYKKTQIDGIIDPIALTFFTISRYEEYWDYTPDDHQRFPSKESLLFKQGLLDEPVVDYWNHQLIFELNLANQSNLVFESRFKYIPTFDIDSTWAFINKGFMRTAATMVIDVLRGSKAKEKRALRMQIFKGNAKDPFDQFDYINSISEKYDFTPIYFWLLGDQSTFDRNIYWRNTKQAEKINECEEFAEIGIHPSYMSNHDVAQLQREVVRLESIVDRTVRKSRQHFLKIDLPSTYNNLVTAGISEDYTMGFADHYGFRAGTCFPFEFFNLRLNEIKSLRIYSITYMDGTLNQYMGLTPDESKVVIDSLIEKVKKVKGTFVSLWHNETLGETGAWKDWSQVLTHTIEQCEK